MADKFISSKEEFLTSLTTVLDTLGLPSDRVHVLSTAYYQTQGLAELYDAVSYSSYITTREMFPITAQFKDSLYKWNKVSDVPINLSSASTRWFTMSMSIEDVLAEAEMIGPDLYRYTLPHTMEVKINDFIYSFDYDINIQIYDPEDKISITATYDTATLYNPISTVTNPNIKVIKEGNNMLLSLPLSQYERVTSTYRYIDSSTDVYTMEYENQLIDFTPYYRENEFTDVVTRLSKTMYYDGSIPSTPTLYYALNDGSITLTNRGYRGNFVPLKDSTIELSIYTTKGDEANFEYIGDDIKLEDKDGVELPFYIKVSADQNVTIEGINEDDLESLRKKVIDSLHTRSSIISEYDLNLHYSQRGKEYRVVKTRDDALYRIYSIYTPLINNDDYVIPTNTVDALINIKDSVDGYIKLPELAHYYLPIGGTTANIVTEKPLTGFDYMSSIALSINTTDRIVETYEMYIDRNSQTEYEYIFDKSAYTFMVNRLYINRLPEKDITFKFNIMTNLASMNSEELKTFHTLDADGNIIDSGELDVSLSFAISTGVYAGHVKAVMKKYIEENDMYEYEATLSTDFFIKNSNIDVQLLDIFGVENTVSISTLLESIKIVVQNSEVVNTEMLPTEYAVPVVSGKGLVNVFSVENFELVKSYTEISGIHIKDVDRDHILIKAVPFFGYDYIEANSYSVYNDVYSEMDYINTLWLQTQTNFTNHIRFANSYGPSNIYIIGNGTEKLDRTDISMKFGIGLVYNSTVDNDYIIDYIQRYFDDIDFLNGEAFHVSDLIRRLRDDIPDLTKVEFNGINNYDISYQYIHTVFDADDPTVVPEIINVAYDNKGQYNITLTKI